MSASLRAVMNTIPDTPNAEAIALRRFQLITKVQELVTQGAPLSLALGTIAHQTLQDVRGPVATRTLEDWFYAYKRGDFAALKPKVRSDREQPRRISPAQQQQILDAVRARPGIPIKVFYRQWKAADANFASLSTVHRLLERHELNARSRRFLIRQSLSTPTKAWESAAPNELWMADFSPGPFLTVAGSAKPLATQLCVILDDHSRLSPCSRYGTAADTRHFHAILKEALRRRGVPKALYVDNGGPFVNDHTRLVCAQLGIRLLHSRPYHAWARGKVERFIQTVQMDFQARLQIPGQADSSLDELNQKLADWLAEYHARVHSTTGLRPDERFAQGLSLVKSLAPELDLERLFHAQATRRVRKDGTVRLENDLYEVDLSLRGLEVRLRFDPWTRQRVEVDYRGQAFGLARLVDRQLNGRLRPDYEKR